MSDEKAWPDIELFFSGTMTMHRFKREQIGSRGVRGLKASVGWGKGDVVLAPWFAGVYARAWSSFPDRACNMSCGTNLVLRRYRCHHTTDFMPCRPSDLVAYVDARGRAFKLTYDKEV